MHDSFFWIDKLIPITNMLINRIALLPHSRLNPTKVFGGKMSECDPAEKMKDKFKLVKKPHDIPLPKLLTPR